MPGIAGIIKGCSVGGTSQSRMQEVILHITEQMRHRDFYATDIYVDERIALGMTTLIPDNKIIFNATKTLSLMFDGEIDDLPNQESILYLYEKEGERFLNKIKGIFNLVIYDCRNKAESRLLLITDRYGFKPLYYTEFGDKFIFASEIKSILTYPDFNKEINLIALSEYAIFNYPLGEHTFVKNIHRVPGAAIWEFKLKCGSLVKKEYWNARALLNKKLLSAQESIEQGSVIFKEVVHSLINRSEKIGLTLTAGYDTRMILSAISNKLPPNKLIRCLTFGDRADIQAVIASKLASITNSEHCVREFGADFTGNVDDFLSRSVWITDGLCNIVHCGLVYVFKDELSNYPYFLGYGGSELIRGLQNTSLAFSQNAKSILLSNSPNETWNKVINNPNSYGLFSDKVLKPNNQLPNPINSQSPVNERVLFFTLFEIFRKYYGSSISLIGSQVRVLLPYMAHKFIEFMLSTPFSVLHTTPFSNNLFERLKGQKFSANIIKNNNSRLLYLPTDRGYKPYDNLYWFGATAIFGHQLYRRIVVGAKRKSRLGGGSSRYDLPSLRLSVKKIIDNIKGRDYYNMQKLKKVAADYPNWSLQEWDELSQVATFELWLRQAMD
ncbi:MAG: hypothetical protein HY769_07950 [Candidatus Stahlbacteria bacterium]|nr:hypothetical protein [Candidatus Stahlbacteria bacterium]